MARMVKVPLEEAHAQGRYISEYTGYINDLAEGEAGKIILDEGESVAAVRRRLVLAAKAMGVMVGTKRSGDDLYFWREPREPGGEARRRRGRPSKRREDEDDVLRTQPEGEEAETSTQLGQLSRD